MIWLTLFFIPFHLVCLVGLTYVGVALIQLTVRAVRRITRWLGPSTETQARANHQWLTQFNREGERP